MPADDREAEQELRRRLLGLGEDSIRKNYYPELLHKIGELEELNRDLELKVEERTRDLKSYIARLEEAKDQLVIAEQAALFSRVIAGIAHEMNTPIGNAYTSASYLLHRLEKLPLSDQGRDRSIEAAELVNRSLERAIRIMERFRTLSPDSYHSNIRRMRLAPAVEECMQSLAGELRGSDLEIEVGKDLYIEADQGLLLQIFTALIENSLSHGRRDDTPHRLSLRAARKEETVELAVEDNGPGAPEELVESLFDPFTSGKRPVGSGLGLFMVQSLMNRNIGGSIRYERSSMGGSAFILSFPVPLAP